MSLRVALSLITSMVLAPTAGAVDGVLCYDGSATMPTYLRAFELSGGTRVTGAYLYLNDRLAAPTAVYLLGSGPGGLPDWDQVEAQVLGPSPSQNEALSVVLRAESVERTRRVWLAAVFERGNDVPGRGASGGPAIGYFRLASVAGDQLLSPDGGRSYDRLDPALSLAMGLTVDSDTGTTVGSTNAMKAGGLTSRRPVKLHAAPNPFNPRTELVFDLPTASVVHLVLYDLRGRKVRTLVDGSRPAGRQHVVWDGRDDQGRPVASGAYRAVLENGKTRLSTSLVLAR